MRPTRCPLRKGNAEGPVNSDTDFADAGRTEAFDNPYVNFGAHGYLPNDRRHQLKLRGAYALARALAVRRDAGACIGSRRSARSARAIRRRSHVLQLLIFTNEDTGQYELRPRGSEGRTPWIFDLGANVGYRQSFSMADLRVKLSVYNLLNQQRIIQVDEELPGSIPNGNPEYRTARLTRARATRC